MHNCGSCGWVSLSPAQKAREMQMQVMLNTGTKHQYYREKLGSEDKISRLYSWLAGVLSKSVTSRKLLDIGCGYGDLMAAFQHSGWDVWGCDISAERVELCRKLRGLERTETADISDQPFPTERFDTITMIDVLAHLHDPYAALNEVRTRLNTNGLLFIQTGVYCKHPPSADEMDAPNHLHAYKLETLLRLMRMSGFKVIRSERFIGSSSLMRKIGLGLMLRAPSIVRPLGRYLADGNRGESNQLHVWLWCCPVESGGELS